MPAKCHSTGTIFDVDICKKCQKSDPEYSIIEVKDEAARVPAIENRPPIETFLEGWIEEIPGSRFSGDPTILTIRSHELIGFLRKLLEAFDAR